MDAEGVFLRQSRMSQIFGLIDRLRRRCSDLLEFDQIVQSGPFSGQHDLGMQTVPVRQIVGTLGRGSDFDRAFRPRRRDMGWRWIQVAKLAQIDGQLPAVDLYKVGSDYFVVDGHHRVSVARASGQIYIDAHVIEVHRSQRLAVFV